MIAFVISAQVLEVNAQSFQYPNYPDGIFKQIPCSGIEIVNSFWRIPVTLGNRVISYNHLVALDSTKPQPDAVKVLRVKDTRDNTEYEFAILDGDNVTSNTFVDNCNGCCGDTPTMPNVSIPYPILQTGPQSTDTDGTNHFVFAFPANPLGLLYSIPWPWFNGAAAVTPYVPTGITTAALFVTWANTNWSSYGTWASPSTNIVTLASPTSAAVPVTEAGLGVSLTPKAWCLDLTSFSTPAAVNGIKFGTSDTIPFGAFMLTDSNQQTLINKISPFMPGATFVISTHKLQITTTQAVVHIYNNATLKATAVTGVC